MKNKRIQNAFARWRGPVLFLIVMFSVILIHFAIVGKAEEKTEVENHMLSQVREYAADLELVLHGVQTGADTVAAFAVGASDTSQGAMDILKAICATKGVYEAAVCDLSGQGYLSDGSPVDLADEEYFRSALAGERKVMYVADDGVTGTEAVLVVSPVIQNQSVTEYVLCYYDASVLQETMQKDDMGSGMFFLLLEQGGQILASAGSNSVFYEDSGNYYEKLRTNQETENVDRMVSRIGNSKEGITYVNADGEESVLFYAPLGIGKLYLLAGVDGEFIDSLEKEEWAISKALIWQTALGLVVFLAVIITINIIDVLKDDEKSRLLENKADTDLLTDLYNKMATERKIKEYLAEHPDETGMMFVLDIDNFKKINDTMGHAFGDEVLRSIGTRIRAEFRATDIVGRTGGDEFTIFLCNMKEEAVIRSEAKRVEQFFKDFRAGEYVKYAITASIGVAVYSQDGKDFNALYKAADHALYVAKKRGKNQLAFYGDEKAEEISQSVQ